MQILNLSSVLADDKKIVVGKDEFIIPGSLSTGRMLELIKHSKNLMENKADPELIEKTFQIVHSILLIRQPDLSYQYFTDVITMDMLPQIISFIYNVNTPEAEEKKTEQSPAPVTE